VLSTLTEHDIQGALKMAKRWELCVRAEADYFEDDSGQQVHRVDQMAAPFREIMDEPSYIVSFQFRVLYH
jgi:hypothetical protein